MLRRIRCILTLTAVVTLAACSGSTGPRSATCSGNAGPPWPASVGGCWIQMGVDTYAELDLVQESTNVTGAFSFCGPIGGCDAYSQVTGTLVGTRVTLQWAGAAFEGTLASTGDTLTDSAGAHAGFVRRTWR